MTKFDYSSAYSSDYDSNMRSSPSELPSEPPELLTPTTCRVAMMIAAKNGAVTTATAAIMTVRKARAPGNFVNANQITPYAAD